MKNRVNEGRHSWTLPGGSVVYEHDAQTAHKKQVLSDGGYWGKKEGETWDQALSRMMYESARGNEAARQEAAYQALMRPQQESAGGRYQEPMDKWQEPWDLAEAQSGAMPIAQEAGAEARAGMDRQYALEERQATAELDKLADKLLRGEPLSLGEYVFLQESMPRTEWQQPTVPLEISPWNERAETAPARKTADSIDKPLHDGYDEEEKKATLLHQVAGFNPYITDTFGLEKYGKPFSKAYADPEKHFKENDSPDYQDSEWWLRKMEEDASKDRKEWRVLQDVRTIPLNIALQVF